tara:strand:- start:561 stop:1421 length:861 start_codon:yes stop_codon:yes gene_type:complete
METAQHYMLSALILPLSVKCKNSKKVKNPRNSKVEKLGFLGFRQLCKFCEFVTVHKLLDNLVISDEPLKLVLVYTVSVCTAELVDDSVQTRFSGVGPPSAVKDANESITNLSDLVTVQVHGRDALIIGHASVSTTPVCAILDGGVHEGLNFTHVVVNKGDQGLLMCCLDSEAGSSGSACEFAYQLVQHEVGAVVIIKHGAVNCAIQCFGEDCELCFGESNSDHGWSGGQQIQYRTDRALGQPILDSSSVGTRWTVSLVNPDSRSISTHSLTILSIWLSTCFTRLAF